MQEKAASGTINYREIPGKLNAADLFTKALPWSDIERHLVKLDTEMVQGQCSIGYNLSILGCGSGALGGNHLKDFIKKNGLDIPLLAWHRVDLQSKTLKTSMRGGPDWCKVVGRDTVDALDGSLITSEQARSITRNLEHALVPKFPRDILTYLIYKYDNNCNNTNNKHEHDNTCQYDYKSVDAAVAVGQDKLRDIDAAVAVGNDRSATSQFCSGIPRNCVFDDKWRVAISVGHCRNILIW